MADFFPFDSGPGSNVAEAQWGLMAKNWLATGVIKGALNEFAVYADSTGMQCKVKSGNAWIQGFFFQTTAETIIPISAANATNPRIDRIAVQVDWTNNNISLIAIQGTPSASPIAPALTQNNSIWQISLAQVYVGANVSTIAAGNITDQRVIVSSTSQIGNFYIRSNASWGGIGSANTLYQVPTLFATGAVVTGYSVSGFHNSNWDIVCDVAGRYVLSIQAMIDGLNAGASFVVQTSIVKSGIQTDDYTVVIGPSGVNANNSFPNGVLNRNQIMVDLAVGDIVRFYVKATETPRNINGFWCMGYKISS
jgi:hypothetical protein